MSEQEQPDSIRLTLSDEGQSEPIRENTENAQVNNQSNPSRISRRRFLQIAAGAGLAAVGYGIKSRNNEIFNVVADLTSDDEVANDQSIETAPIATATPERAELTPQEIERIKDHIAPNFIDTVKRLVSTDAQQLFFSADELSPDFVVEEFKKGNLSYAQLEVNGIEGKGQQLKVIYGDGRTDKAGNKQIQVGDYIEVALTKRADDYERAVSVRHSSFNDVKIEPEEGNIEEYLGKLYQLPEEMVGKMKVDGSENVRHDTDPYNYSYTSRTYDEPNYLAVFTQGYVKKYEEGKPDSSVLDSVHYFGVYKKEATKIIVTADQKGNKTDFTIEEQRADDEFPLQTV